MGERFSLPDPLLASTQTHTDCKLIIIEIKKFDLKDSPKIVVVVVVVVAVVVVAIGVATTNVNQEMALKRPEKDSFKSKEMKLTTFTCGLDTFKKHIPIFIAFFFPFINVGPCTV